ncbi:50S ribosomal protein L24 [archaeon]|jgi:large subunit ribosomal protein L24|nr:50S ribosomal protein L24 [archaeon]MBT4373159.1 50S ribosomal protein L24 [archaeon]MBT4531504.1 50S ribosomal protein L24 [archaeon]MBT7001318.1 50S ribosomal protein L24 [archaeon]MBT7282196.1 50S ribosomal protein L24 [archaeon]
MKKEFSTAWKASKQPRKQRKFRANAPIHIKRKLLGVNLAKDLRKKVGARNVVIRKEDKVKIMRGKFKGKEGKILQVFTKQGKVTIEGIQAKKQDGSKVVIKMQPSNLQIVSMVDRTAKTKKTATETTKKTKKKEKVEKKIDPKTKTNKEKK